MQWILLDVSRDLDSPLPLQSQNGHWYSAMSYIDKWRWILKQELSPRARTRASRFNGRTAKSTLSDEYLRQQANETDFLQGRRLEGPKLSIKK